MPDWKIQYALWLKNNDSLLNQLAPLLPTNAQAEHKEQLRLAIDTYFNSLFAAELIFQNSYRPEIKELHKSAKNIEIILNQHGEIINLLIRTIFESPAPEVSHANISKVLQDAKQLCSKLAEAAWLLDSEWDKRNRGRPENKARNNLINDLTKLFVRAGGVDTLPTNTEKTIHTGPYYSFISKACSLVGDELQSGQALEKILSRHLK